jgi:energy-coupling factor transporter ATP-binding protein EcfA2
MSKKKIDNFEIENIYQRKDMKKFIKKVHNPNYELHHIEIPFRMLIIGSSGSGKTMSLLNILRIFTNTFQNIHIITKNSSEPLYQYLEEKMRNKSFKLTEGMNSLPLLDDFDKNENSLIVLDDMVLDKDQSKICEFFIRARKLNISLIYISQSYFLVPKVIRQNLTYLIIKQVSSQRNLKLIANEYSLGLDNKQLKKLYEFCTDEIPNFLLIDINNKNMRFRKNFDFVIDISSL